MNFEPDNSTPRFQIPLAVPIGLISVLLLGGVAYVVYSRTYQIAIDELKEHEIVDLADETRKNADALKTILTQLREDVLAAAQHPQVQAYVSADMSEQQSLREDIGAALIDICRVPGNGKTPDHASPWKHYMQVRLIDSNGHERVRVHRVGRANPGSTNGVVSMEKVEAKILDDDAALPKDNRKHDKSDKAYWTQAKELFDDISRDPSKRLNASMSAIDFNSESDTSSVMHGVLTVRASVPLTHVVDGNPEFRGIMIINLDLESTLRNLTNATRHLVYVGMGETQEPGSPADPPRLIYDPDYLSIRNTAGFPDFLTTLVGDIVSSNGAQMLEHDLNTIFELAHENREAGVRGDAVLRLEDRGQRLPSQAGDVLRVAKPFYLAKLQLIRSRTGGNKEKFFADFREKLREIHKVAREDETNGKTSSVRIQPVVRSDQTGVNVRAADKEALKAVVAELESFGSEGWSLKRRYSQPQKCETFAAHFYRIYFDPVRPHRYLALLVGFSYEELEADLAGTRRNAAIAAIVSAVIGAMLLMLAIWRFVTRPVHQLTCASQAIADGDFSTTLPVEQRSEIGTLSRVFKQMVREVRARDVRIRRQNSKLDEKVKERTASLSEARDKLEAAVNSRDAFVASVSHELRTPLNHIYGYSQLLELTDLDDEQRSDLKKLQTSSRHLLRLVQDILDFQKIIMGRLPIVPVKFNVAALLESVRESNSRKAAERNNEIVLKMQGLDDTIFNDESRLRQVLDNLVGNACKFTSDSTITLTAVREDELIRIVVADTGIGISAEGIEQLFQPFSKVSDSSLNPDGTGLGLVISRDLARKMGGDVTVTSIIGEGSEFEVTILATIPETESDTERFVLTSDTVTKMNKLNPQAQTKDKPSQSSRRVLVIDDDPTARELISRFLTEEGLEVMTAATGTEGIELAAKHCPAVITLDLVMPEVDGWSVLAALKANERTADIPVVLATVLDDPDKGYSFGATDYLSKPISGERLNQVVSRYCGVLPRKILVIDDNPKDREIVRRILANDGCEVIEAVNGADGLARFDDCAPDLVILDLTMPVMDGFAFVDELRNRSDQELPPIIVVTAREMTPENTARLNHSVAEIIQKGHFDRRMLIEEVRHQLEMKGSLS